MPHLTEGHLMMGPKEVAQLVAVCIMLHNTALWHNIPLVPGVEAQEPCTSVPSSEEEVQDDAQLMVFSHKVPYPLMVLK